MLRPLNDRVIVSRVEEKDVIKNGVFIPDSAVEKPQEGLVIAAGPGPLFEGKRVPLDVKAGDKILFGKYAGNEVVVDGEKLLILREDEIFAIDE